MSISSGGRGYIPEADSCIMLNRYSSDADILPYKISQYIPSFKDNHVQYGAKDFDNSEFGISDSLATRGTRTVEPNIRELDKVTGRQEAFQTNHLTCTRDPTEASVSSRRSSALGSRYNMAYTAGPKNINITEVADKFLYGRIKALNDVEGTVLSFYKGIAIEK